MKKNYQEGITLISLVVTIIVLLILSGVTINATVGENGIFTKIKNAEKLTRINEGINEISLGMLNIHADSIINGKIYDLELIEEELPKELKNLSIIGTHGNPVNKLYVKYKDFNYMIDGQDNIIYVEEVDFNTIPDIIIVQDETATGVEQVVLNISGEVELGKITKIETPTGEITGAAGEYTITENGEYTFKVVTNKNQETSKTIKISNIKEKNGINVTSLIAGGDAHEHIYTSKYDNNYHWQQCTICDNVINKKAHTIETIGNAATCDTLIILGKEICTDNCGYSKQIEHLEHIRPENPEWTNLDGVYHASYQCERCGGEGNNALLERHTFNINGEILDNVQINQKGIDIHSLGTLTCTICGLDVDLSKHYILTEMCSICFENIGAVMTFDIPENNMKNGKIQVDLINNETQDIYFQVDSKGFGYAGIAPWLNLGKDKYNINKTELVKQEGDIYLFKSNISLKNTNDNLDGEMLFIGWFTTAKKAGEIVGKYEVLNQVDSWKKVYIIPETTPPEITNIQATSIKEVDGWATNKQIKVTGTAVKNEIVYISMYDQNGKAIFEKSAVQVNNGNYEFTTTPILEVQEPSTFTIKVEDMFGNAKTQEITLEKIDSKTPELTVSSTDNGKWNQAITYKVEATDSGIGQVKYSFNTQDNFVLGNVENEKYVKEYTLTGDVYEAKPAMIYVKDALGNLVSKKITIGKIDTTSPTITKVNQEKVSEGTKITIEANDINTTINKEGSGIVGYAITKSKQTPSEKVYKTNKEFNLSEPGTYYVWAKDAAGNISSRYELTVQ